MTKKRWYPVTHMRTEWIGNRQAAGPLCEGAEHDDDRLTTHPVKVSCQECQALLKRDRDRLRRTYREAQEAAFGVHSRLANGLR